ncbi:DUF4328 domain-containing protein [Actinopolyspora mortivallis]|uniref:DUF4328 domain-containing protein n=1 Tax=Actinopolyspora mortivallis TaxID=33906 RepID=UPI000479E7F5|nr:DUF4328 domain-containing protein [Actinopolyspora mortivallis]
MNTAHPRSGPRTEWTATPPSGPERPRPPAAPRAPYQGPPAYVAPPRWGFPPLGWRWPLALPTTRRSDPAERLAALSGTVVSTLWITAGLGVLAAGAEAWRYVLLLWSRSGALGGVTVAVSDALVSTLGIVTWLFGLLAVVLGVLWVLRARTCAHERAGLLPAREDWQVVLGTAVPGVNLFVPGSVLAELEDVTLRGVGERSGAGRPVPSRLVRLWWLCWVGCLLLGWTTMLWGLRDGVQAMADGVVLHACSDLALSVTALVSVRVVGWTVRMLVPPDPTSRGRGRVLRVRGAPPPPRAGRPPHAVR